MKAPIKKKQILHAKADDRKVRNNIYFIIVIACFVFYGNTLTLNYAFDDLVAITGNQFTKAGIKGIPDILTTDLFAGFYGKDNNMVAGGRYRPLSIVTFAVEYQFFGANPTVSHLINLILLILTGLVMYKLLFELVVLKGIPPDPKKWYITVPFLTTLFFIGHPVHTEVIANIKGRDEILALLLALLSMKLIIDYPAKNSKSNLFLASVTFFFALLSKENSITFLIIIPLTIWFFTKHTFRSIVITSIPLVVSAAVFLLIRQLVIGHNASGGLENDLMNNPFIEMNLMQKYATIFYTLGLYLKLLIFPHPLTFDYYPYHIPIVSLTEFRAIFSFLCYLAMGLYVIVAFRKREAGTYAILYYFITLSIVSNLLFPIGAFMNERFLYMPSLGYCLGLAWLLAPETLPVLAKRSWPSWLIPGIILVILTLYGFKTITRNRAWNDSYTLFTTDVKVSSNSAKGNALAGEYLIQRAGQVKNAALRDSLLRQSIQYQQKAIQIYPKQIIALFNLAAAYYEYNKNYDTILTVYTTILHYLPDNQKVYQNFLLLMNQYQNGDHKLELFKRLYEVNPQRYDVNVNLGVLYMNVKHDPVSAVPYLETAARLNPSDFSAQNNLGMAYGMSNNWPGAKKAFEAAERINPGDPQLLKNLAAVYQNLGLRDKSREYLERINKPVNGKSQQ